MEVTCLWRVVSFDHKRLFCSFATYTVNICKVCIKKTFNILHRETVACVQLAFCDSTNLPPDVKRKINRPEVNTKYSSPRLQYQRNSHSKQPGFPPTSWHPSAFPHAAPQTIRSMYEGPSPATSKYSQKTKACSSTDTLNGSFSLFRDPCMHSWACLWIDAYSRGVQEVPHNLIKPLSMSHKDGYVYKRYAREINADMDTQVCFSFISSTQNCGVLDDHLREVTWLHIFVLCSCKLISMLHSAITAEPLSVAWRIYVVFGTDFQAKHCETKKLSKAQQCF